MRSLSISTTTDELTNELGQPVAWTERVVLMLIDVRRAHCNNPARRKVFVELPEEASTDEQEHVWLPRGWSEVGICDLPSHDCNWLCAG